MAQWLSVLAAPAEDLGSQNPDRDFQPSIAHMVNIYTLKINYRFESGRYGLFSTYIYCLNYIKE